jgi:drug/metabolite transporter (DMT)-like permease
VVALALLSALSWGTGDFLGGLLSRRERVIVVLALSQAAGLVFALVLVAAAGGTPPGLGDLWPAFLAGAAGAGALACFYRALAIGTMSVVAPVSATAVVVPVVSGLVTGDRPGAAQVAGIACAVAGVVLASREEVAHDAQEREGGRQVLALALLAALGFGVFLTAIAPASDASVPWALLCVRGTSVALCLGALALAGAPRLPRRADAAPLAVIGLLDIGANALYAAATTKGLLSLASVLGSLYPVTTVVLARTVLHERLVRTQQAGVGLAFAGVALIAGG